MGLFKSRTLSDIIEKWKPISFCPDRYEISNYGRVRRLKRKIMRSNGSPMVLKEKIIKGWLNEDGYNVHKLYLEHGRANISAHRLCAWHFVGNPENKPEVNHKDGNKVNNFYKNLEFVTSSENVQHAFDNGLMENQARGERQHLSKLKANDIPKIRKMSSDGYFANEIADIYDVHKSTIQRVLNGKTWKHI